MREGERMDKRRVGMMRELFASWRRDIDNSSRSSSNGFACRVRLRRCLALRECGQQVFSTLLSLFCCVVLTPFLLICVSALLMVHNVPHEAALQANEVKCKMVVECVCMITAFFVCVCVYEYSGFVCVCVYVHVCYGMMIAGVT